MLTVQVDKRKVLCVLISDEDERTQCAKQFLQSALSCSTSVASMVQSFETHGVYASSPNYQFFSKCMVELSPYRSYSSVFSSMGFVTDGPFIGYCAIGCGSNKRKRERAMYLSLALTLLARFNQPRINTLSFKTPDLNALYESAAKTLCVDQVEPWIEYFDFDDDSSEVSEEQVPDPIANDEKHDLLLRLKIAIRSARECPGLPKRFMSRFPEWPLRLALGKKKGDPFDLRGLRILVIGMPINGWKVNEPPYFPVKILEDFIVLVLDRNDGPLQYCRVAN